MEGDNQRHGVPQLGLVHGVRDARSLIPGATYVRDPKNPMWALAAMRIVESMHRYNRTLRVMYDDSGRAGIMVRMSNGPSKASTSTVIA